MRAGTIAAIIAFAITAALSMSGEVSAKQRSAADKALFNKAAQKCNGPQYPNGARIDIDYKKGTFRCIEPTNHNRR